MANVQAQTLTSRMRMKQQKLDLNGVQPKQIFNSAVLHLQWLSRALSRCYLQEAPKSDSLLLRHSARLAVVRKQKL